jgi:predicted S18 family serine protease
VNATLVIIDRSAKARRVPGATHAVSGTLAPGGDRVAYLVVPHPLDTHGSVAIAAAGGTRLTGIEAHRDAGIAWS